MLAVDWAYWDVLRQNFVFRPLIMLDVMTSRLYWGIFPQAVPKIPLLSLWQRS